MLAFVGLHTVFVVTIHLCPCGVKAITDNVETKEYDCVQAQLHLWTMALIFI